MVKKKIMVLGLGILFTVSLFSACSLKKDTIIPEDIITKAVSASEKPKSYYGESTTSIYIDNKLSESYTMREWIDNSGSKVKRRTEVEQPKDKAGDTISTNDGNNIIIYMKKDKKAMKINMTDGSDSGNPADSNYKNQLIKQLGTISKTHKIVFKGEENILNRKTYHISAISKQENSIIGDMDLWIDEQNWLVIKSTSKIKNTRTECVYTKLNFSPKFDSSLFVQKLPSDVKIEDISSKINGSEKDISLNEAVKLLNKPILYMPETSEYKLKSVKSLGGMEKVISTEIDQAYEKNGAVEFTLTTIIPNNQNKNHEDIKIPGEKTVKVRGKTGTSMDDVIKNIAWSEDGVNYSLSLENNNLNIDDALKIAEKLVHTN